ncbi:unnamed protein product [Gongylonema pulchrum]|uniref:RRM domain-containing protein n=1 Tax=Gongylonema pulchrum TaxID=637853 RepID=A0A183EUQ8_9BILA|nr:unnamed protein product [Gongylonema pulchrum]
MNKADGLEPEQFRKLFIGGLSITTSDEALKDYYSQWGELVDCIVMRDPSTKRSRGFGFVSFSKQSEVDAAMAARPHMIDGKQVDPKRAVPRDQSTRSEANVSSKRLYVSGVREEHTEQVFEEYFSQFGKVQKVRKMFFFFLKKRKCFFSGCLEKLEVKTSLYLCEIRALRK